VREQLDRWIGVGSIIAVAVVPTVLVLMPLTRNEPAGTTGQPGPSTAAGGVEGPAIPTPTDGPPPPVPAGRNSGTLPDIDAPRTGQGGGGSSAPAQSAGYNVPADDGARITAVKWSGKRRADISISSPALGSTQKVRLLVPRGWSASSTRTWPTLYAFHGGNDTYISWTRSTDIDRVSAAYDVLVAMPEGSNGSYADWYNGGQGGTPRWETFHTQEVRQLLERNFRAGAARAAMGISSGAQGALTYASRHPGMYRYAAAYSGVLSMLSPGIPALLLFINTRAGQDANRIWGDPVRDRANWAAHDPTTLAGNLRGTGVYVSSGNGSAGPLDKGGHAPWDIRYLSESQVERTNRDFVSRARAAGVSVTSDFYGPGSHTWGYWRREMHETLPTIMKALGARRF
jgi:S-formylglutathione hydrolase FrmB